MMKWISFAFSKVAMMALFRILNIPFETIIRVFIGIFNAVKAHMPDKVDFPYEVVKKSDRKKFFN